MLRNASGKARWSIILAVVAVVGVFWWLSDNYLSPPVKAAVDVREDQIMIQNLNRISWKDPAFTLDDEAKLRVPGDWAPLEQRVFSASQFRNPSNGRPHDLNAKKGFQMTVHMAGFERTRLYNWELP
jgi:hypothetical protein